MLHHTSSARSYSPYESWQYIATLSLHFPTFWTPHKRQISTSRMNPAGTKMQTTTFARQKSLFSFVTPLSVKRACSRVYSLFEAVLYGRRLKCYPPTQVIFSFATSSPAPSSLWSGGRFFKMRYAEKTVVQPPSEKRKMHPYSLNHVHVIRPVNVPESSAAASSQLSETFIKRVNRSRTRSSRCSSLHGHFRSRVSPSDPSLHLHSRWVRFLH